MYKVVFYTLPSGRSPARESFYQADVRIRRKILRHVKYLEEFGVTSENRYLRKLSGTPLWESRILGKDNIRIICVAIIEKSVVILHIFRKKSDKTSLADIEISLQRYKDLTTYI